MERRDLPEFLFFPHHVVLQFQLLEYLDLLGHEVITTMKNMFML